MQPTDREILLRRAGYLMEELDFPFERAYRVAVMWLKEERRRERMRPKKQQSAVYNSVDKKRLLDPAHERLAARIARNTLMGSEQAHQLAAQTAREAEKK